MFIDRVKIFVAAGNGGDGCNSLHRDRQIRRGRPDGGDGGDGGNIVFEADPNTRTLYDFKFNRIFRAEKGTHGSSNHKKGRSGQDRIIKVPPGTVIIEEETDLVLRDLVDYQQRVIVCKGGRCGKGNSRGREATKGELGEARDLRLELKLIADVGIVGFPNAGKSTLISRTSNAKSKIAAYPFTTKNPILGVIKRDDERLIMADMPGLIEGAHEGRGLGDRFLRHIERTKFLVHLIDMAAVDGRDPVSDYKKVNKELGLYSSKFSKEGQVIAANKMDMPEAEGNLKKFKKSVKRKIYPISALTGEGTKQLMHALFNKLKEYA